MVVVTSEYQFLITTTTPFKNYSVKSRLNFTRFVTFVNKVSMFLKNVKSPQI